MNKLFNGDCREVMAEFSYRTFDSIVCDPPYGLEFMGKDWDKGVPGVAYWKEALRVLKPGGYLLAFGGTRTYHRMACAIEDAGFELRDCVMWLYGSGFPKSLDVGKKDEKWRGWGTALKPAYEPIILARKPLEEGRTVVGNVLRYGTGALNIDASRVPVSSEDAAKGRWPANIIHDGSEEVLETFPEAPGQQGDLEGHDNERQSPNGIFGKMAPAHNHPKRNEINKSAARFFYCPKANRSEREQGCDGLAEKAFGMSNQAKAEVKRGTVVFSNAGLGVNTVKKVRNNHPTVKPIALMRYLCRMVTQPNGVILDPFMGSGTTGIAAIEEGFSFTGIEIDKNYFEIATSRINDVAPEEKCEFD